MARHTRPIRPAGTPLPRKGKLIFQGKPYYIASVRQLPEGGHSYTLYPFDHVAKTLHNITRQQIIHEIEKYARYQIGQKVVLGNSVQMEIFKRQWDFRSGTPWYYVADPRRNVGAGWLSQTTMMKHDRELVL